MGVYNLFGEKLLLQKISENDEASFRQLFNTYNRIIYAFVKDFIHSADDAEEIVQETFVILWNNRSTLTGIEHPRNYIYTIARNKCYDYIARLARNEKALKHAWEQSVDSCNDTEDLLYSKESLKMINLALTKLSAQKQEVFKLSRYENLSHEEIADATGLSRSRVKNIIVEVLKHLKVRLKYVSVFLLVIFF